MMPPAISHNRYDRVITPASRSLQEQLLSEVKAKQWYPVVGRENSPLFESLIRMGGTADNPEWGFLNPMRSFAALQYQTFAVREEFRELSTLFQEKALANPAFLGRFFLFLERDATMLHDLAVRISKASLHDAKNEELLAHCTTLFNAMLKVLTYLWPPLAIEDWLLEQVTNELRKHIDPVTQFSTLTQVLSVLTAPPHPTPAQKKHDAMVALKRKKVPVQDAKHVFEEYAWLTDSFLHFKYQSWDSFVEEYQNVNVDSLDVKERSEREESTTSEHHARSRCLKKLSATARQYAEQASKLSHWRLLRTESIIQAFYIAQPLMKLVSERIELPDITNAYYWEVQNALTTPTTELEANQRSTGFGLIVLDSIPYDLDGATAKKLKMRLAQEYQQKHEFTGNIACMGKGQGLVCLISTPDEVHKMQQGNVLVTSMTMPAYVPAMKKAVAIVTDEGGISCHAAILSRELKIPCIIGTKQATKQLKDGDEVFVDANNGIVKVLHRA